MSRNTRKFKLDNSEFIKTKQKLSVKFFDEMFNFHNKSRSVITVGLKEFSYENPYGVIKNFKYGDNFTQNSISSIGKESCKYTNSSRI